MKRKLHAQDILIAVFFFFALIAVIAAGNMQAKFRLAPNEKTSEILPERPAFDVFPSVTNGLPEWDSIVYVTSSGRCWHRSAECRSLSRSQVIGVSYGQAVSEGKTPCKLCSGIEDDSG